VVSTAASQRHGPGFDSRIGSLFVWNLHILPVSAWVSSGFSGFLPQSIDVRVRWIGRAKLPISSGRLARGNGDRTWVGLWSIQTRWAEWSPSALSDSMFKLCGAYQI